MLLKLFPIGLEMKSISVACGRTVKSLFERSLYAPDVFETFR